MTQKSWFRSLLLLLLIIPASTIGMVANESLASRVGVFLGKASRPVYEAITPYLKSRWVQGATALAAVHYMLPGNNCQHWVWPETAERTAGSHTVDEQALNNLNFYNSLQREPFLFGTGTSSIQVDGGHTPENSAWCEMVANKQAENPASYKVQPGIACDQWHRYKEDIALMKNELNANAYRMSVSWSLIQPNGPDSWDEEALNHYADVCDELVRNGIRPAITLHHYDDPVWFLRDHKGFETEEGINYFVAYCTKVYDTLKDRGVHLWLTFNSPVEYAINGYMLGERPPAYKGTANMLYARKIASNLLEAHARAYRSIHALYQCHQQNPLINKPRVGILKNIYQVDPWVYHVGSLSFSATHAKLFSALANWLTDSVFYNFFKEHKNVLDFIGLNYYSHGIVKNGPKPVRDETEVPTNNPRNSISAEGLYRALHTIADKIAKPLNIPIYITENGIGAGNDDALRILFLKRYLYAISHAIQEDGLDIRGYFHWSFMDNYEWGTYKNGYGFYAIDRTIDETTGNPRLTRTLRPSAQPFIDAASTYQQQYEASRQINRSGSKKTPYRLSQQS